MEESKVPKWFMFIFMILSSITAGCAAIGALVMMVTIYGYVIGELPSEVWYIFGIFGVVTVLAFAFEFISYRMFGKILKEKKDDVGK
ncbi:MAG: hypothetical protein ACXAC5_04540 [Promethearchaeota archaeon]|jgi:hypothetical protein